MVLGDFEVALRKYKEKLPAGNTRRQNNRYELMTVRLHEKTIQHRAPQCAQQRQDEQDRRRSLRHIRHLKISAAVSKKRNRVNRKQITIRGTETQRYN
jgi:hypothetical protein